ncbi:MAG TPA: TIGR02757 family protein [Myxococcota bacterium]|nr:TIGR02757 family protein [Myxococcota bacterium]
MTELRAGLEALYASCDFQARLATDPVRFPRRYSDPGDIEVAGFLAATYAFGRVELFGAVLERLLASMGPSPRDFVETYDGASLASFEYRWLKAARLQALIRSMRLVLAERGSLEAVAVEAFDGGLASCLEALGDALGPEVARPSKGSACKRMCMWLRWMVRPPTEGIDLGTWDLPSSALVVPLDTHVARIARLVGLTTRKTDGWRTALDITRGLSELDPVDPVRFDFAIAHLGISGACRGSHDAELCPPCSLRGSCSAGGSA